jgi:hypothetical protein
MKITAQRPPSLQRTVLTQSSMSKSRGTTLDRIKEDGVAYGPPISLPIIVLFLSATGHDTNLVKWTAIASLVAGAVIYLLIRADRPSPTHMMLSVLSAGILLSVLITHWPLRVAFQVARPELDRIAEITRDAGSIDDGFAGWFRIEHGRLVERSVVLEFAGIKYGRCAFVQDAGDQVDGYRLNNRWTHTQLR